MSMVMTAHWKSSETPSSGFPESFAKQDATPGVLFCLLIDKTGFVTEPEAW